MWEALVALAIANQASSTAAAQLDVHTTTAAHKAEVEAVAALLEGSAREQLPPGQHWLPGATIHQRGLPDHPDEPGPLTSSEQADLVRGCRSGDASRDENETVRVYLHCAGQTRAAIFAMDGSQIRSVVFDVCCVFSAPPPGVPGLPQNTTQRWRRHLPYDLPANFEYEASTLSGRGQIVSVWMRWDMHRVVGSRNQAAGRHIQLSEVDCARRRMAIRRFITFDLRGVVVAEDGPAAPEEPIPAGSIADHLRGAACGMT